MTYDNQKAIDACELCDDEGFIAIDEYDEDTHQYMRGVGTEKCTHVEY